MSRMVWLGPLAWLMVVAGVSGLAWVAIGQAGREVSASDSHRLLDPAAVATLPTTAPAARPTKVPAAPAKPSAMPTPASPGTHTAPPAPAPAPVVRTWSGAPGTASVSCTGSVARLVGATPADGWQVVRSDDVNGLAVTFARGTSRTEVHAGCSGGVPTFSAADDNHEPGDD